MIEVGIYDSNCTNEVARFKDSTGLDYVDPVVGDYYLTSIWFCNKL